ncbi:ABC transporter ATP-binding protein [Ancylobacter sonchi]|uniref:ABC transporter ATP-binding protein n=1 Tax=Ancylobacter sonchi TaxID=1937790 RepID=UPI001BD44070|nr:ABC transporter ATP-binding protein [Ancylobacter sonchi]MBS7534264.1 ABC transporter ATP-binding protein [Ancylobacter sonchi]
MLARAEHAGEARGAGLEIRALHKSYGHFHAVKGIDLTVQPGEFLTFLGPSGSGKTTTLNIIAGFETPTAGEVLFDGRPLVNTPPYRRDIGMVFQNYALFPHLTVEENVAFPLTVRKLSRAAVAEKVAQALGMVQLGHLGARYPAQLSGGQQQRVALARALVFNPRLVLMDEPLGALDKKLRDHMQVELMHLHRSLGVTIIYVTHDQGEALTMSNRIGVFQDGRLVQVDTPDIIYRSPATLFVSDFVGENNHLDGTVEERHAEGCAVRLESGLRIESRSGEVGPGDAVRLTLRPESIAILPAGTVSGEDNRFAGRVVERIYFGDHQRLVVQLQGGVTVMVKASPSLALPPGSPVELGWPAAACHPFRLS